MPQVLMALMRHESIDTSMRFYVGRNAQTTADVVWEAYTKAHSEKTEKGTVPSTVEPAEEKDALKEKTQPRSDTEVAEVAAVGVEPTTRGL